MDNCCNNVIGVNGVEDGFVSVVGEANTDITFGGGIVVVLSGGSTGATGPMPTLSDLISMLVSLPKRSSDEAAVTAGDKIYIAKNHVSAPDGAIMVSTITL